MVTRIIICNLMIYISWICQRYRFAVPKVSFRCAKGYVWGDEIWPLGRSKLIFHGARAKLSQNEEWRMKSEKSSFTQFNIFCHFSQTSFCRDSLHYFPTEINAAGIRFGDVPHNGKNASGIFPCLCELCISLNMFILTYNWT